MSGRVPRRRDTRSRTHSSSLRKRRPTGMQHRLLGIDPVPMTIFEPVSLAGRPADLSVAADEIAWSRFAPRIPAPRGPNRGKRFRDA
jgi:hypothetical protein